MWHIVRRGLDLKSIERFPRSRTIGGSSKHGVVRPLMYRGNQFLLVSKEMPLKNKKIFKREVQVGSIKGIEACGPRVFAWRITSTKCEYIMDNLARGDKDAKVRTFANYQGIRPWRKLYDVLLKFYKVTGGFHGDLHLNNIAIITKGSRVTVQVYDYGTWHPFSRRVTGNKIMPYLAAAKARPGNVNRGNGVFKPRNGGQLYRENADMLGANVLRAFRRYNGGSPSNSLFNVSS